MKQIKRTEYKFACLNWEHEPINSTDLVKLSETKQGWKKSTTYTILRKLCERGILRNENATVTGIVKKTDAQKYESQTVIEKAFNGSLPQFLIIKEFKRFMGHSPAKYTSLQNEVDEIIYV